MKLVPLAALILATASHADSPLPPPRAFTTCSASQEYCVDFVPGKDGVAFQVDKEGRRKAIWRVPGWMRVAYLSDDGKHLASCHGGLNLIPQDYTPELVMVSVFENGRLSREIRLKDLISDFGALQKTASHYHWGGCAGLSEDGRLQVDTVEHRTLFIDLSTGKVHRR